MCVCVSVSLPMTNSSLALFLSFVVVLLYLPTHYENMIRLLACHWHHHHHHHRRRYESNDRSLVRICFVSRITITRVNKYHP